MLNIGPQELFIILVIALLVVGPQRLPALGRSIGRGLRELRKAQDEVKRTIQVGMSDAMRFTPDAITVRRGETVKFVFRNEGNQLHEFVLGTTKELEKHAALMLKFPNMEHDEPYMAHVPAGKTAEIIWTFNRPGDFDFACLIAGHYQAGMVGKITVSAK